MSIEEGFLEVTGGKVWYQKHEGIHNNIPVIILHGGPGSSHYSLQGLKELAVDRPVIFYDQLGCGKSERPADRKLWKIDRFVEELNQIVKGLELEEFHLLGHSWGTTLAAAYALKHPLGIKSIIFSSPCLSAPLWAKDQMKNREQLPIDVQIALKTGERFGTTETDEYKKATEVFNKHFVCRLDKLPAFLKDGAKYKNREIYNLMWGPSEFYVTGNLKDYDCTGELKNITVPTLFTCGRYDEATPESTEYYSTLTTNSKFHVFENSAHMPYIEEADAYMNVMKDFLSTIR
ncbi:alpha/beta fold hydrolase [Oceanobacillus piezotolerans]|uniref:Proline iminopeptidase n=1 Tax=Oceanobacillus piezotolerans TaxID=2448030 RepID=A0A498D477_9BACI|nr:proline iminopeptidase-family hydrolase [Oceanobacillus piezotolerans]RLL43675.1 alpha/beta fold hydrolase [Oceanobacillus piezotolerans]